jgi:hypothetical protein
MGSGVLGDYLDAQKNLLASNMLHRLIRWCRLTPPTQWSCTMNNFPTLPTEADHKLEQVIARDHYERLRNRLVALQSAPDSKAAAIDTVIEELALAQRIYKATHGLVGNNPIED